jgi:hypothetical protein
MVPPYYWMGGQLVSARRRAPSRFPAAQPKNVYRARSPHQACIHLGRIQPGQKANALVCLGLPAQTPVLLFAAVEMNKQVVCIHHPNFKCCPPPYGGEQGRKGKGCPNPHAVSLKPSPHLTAEPQCRSGALKRSQFNAYQFMGVTPPFSGLKGSARL